MLYFNSFCNIWENPKFHSANDSFINRTSDIFELRLKDQYIQHFDTKCSESNICIVFNLCRNNTVLMITWIE